MLPILLTTLAFGFASSDDILTLTGWNGGRIEDSELFMEDGRDDCNIPDYPTAVQSAFGFANDDGLPFVCGGLLR